MSLACSTHEDADCSGPGRGRLRYSSRRQACGNPANCDARRHRAGKMIHKQGTAQPISTSEKKHKENTKVTQACTNPYSPQRGDINLPAPPSASCQSVTRPEYGISGLPLSSTKGLELCGRTLQVIDRRCVTSKDSDQSTTAAFFPQILSGDLMGEEEGR